MSEKERPVHPSAEEVAEDGVRVLRDAATDARGVVVHGTSQKPISTSETNDAPKAEDTAI